MIDSKQREDEEVVGKVKITSPPRVKASVKPSLPSFSSIYSSSAHLTWVSSP